MKKTGLSNKQISGWNNLFRIISITNNQGYSFLLDVAKRWDETKKQIAGNITNNLKYELLKESGTSKGLITFIYENKKLVAYVEYVDKLTLQLHAYMTPEEI